MCTTPEPLFTPVKRLVVCLYASVVGYRFWRSLRPELSLPKLGSLPCQKDIQEKARASLASSGVFFAFTVAVLAAVVGAADAREELRGVFKVILLGQKAPVFLFLGGLVFPYVAIWLERFISAGSMEKEATTKCWRLVGYFALVVWLILTMSFFLAIRRFLPQGILHDDVIKKAFSLSGLVLVFGSAFFLLFAVEFYDSASGWRRRIEFNKGATQVAKCGTTESCNDVQPGAKLTDDLANQGGCQHQGENPPRKQPTTNAQSHDNAQRPSPLHFHLASLASHSTAIGVGLAFAGLSLLLCLVDVRAGRVAICITLLGLVSMTEIERALWDLQP